LINGISLRAFFRRFGIMHLLGVAAVLHIALTLTLFIVGRAQVLPAQFDKSGIGTFADDGYIYRKEVVSLAETLKTKGVAAWASQPSQLHVRLYALPHALVGSWSDFNILTIEPLNLIYYLLIVFLTYNLGRKVFDRRVGLLAASIVALWPSLLLHTTQLLRDPLLIVALLTFILVVIETLTLRCSWRRSLICIVGAALAAIVIWIVRMSAWEVVKVVTYLSLPCLLIQVWRDKRVWLPNLVAAALLMMIISLVPLLKGLVRNQQFSVKAGPNQIAEQVQGLPLWAKIARRRHFFATEPSHDGSPIGSNVDADVEFYGPTDIVWYTPRAAVIGFLAPFPDMWIGGGKHVGSAGRFLSGAEMLVTYFIELLAIACLWMKRKCLITWFLFLILTIGVVGLSLILVNIGTLYRQRYPFWVLLVVLGAGGAVKMISYVSSRRAHKMSESVAVV
jgi:hypothetical protein